MAELWEGDGAMSEQGLPAEQPAGTDGATGLVGVVPADERWRRYGTRPNWIRKHVFGVREEPPVSYVGTIVPPCADRPATGVCCSGGGIRSASFNLGVLQALQEARRLQQVHYLAAVSGGSYIAAAFAMVSKTKGEDGDDSDPRLLSPSRPAFYPGSPEEQYLRNRVSYMAPTGADKALLIWRVILGLVVNLLLIAAAVTVVAALLSLYYRHADPGLIRPPRKGEHGASPSGAVWGIGLAIAALGIVLGATAIVLRPSQTGGVLHQLERWAPRLFALGLGVFALELIVPVLIDVMRKDHGTAPVQHTETVGAGITASVAAILGTILTQIRAQVSAPVKAVEDAGKTIKKLPERLRLTAVYLATGIVGPLLVLALLVASTMVQVENTGVATRVALPLGALVFLAVVFRFGDLNSWSLHPFYRQRLCTAFALRRIADRDDPPGPQPNDPDDVPRPRGHAEPRALAERVPLHKTRVVPEVPPFPSTDWPS
jgi:hypothetical protein